MKKLIAFSVALLASTLVLAAQTGLQYCADPGGTWSVANGNYYGHVNLKMDSSGNITGSGTWNVVLCYPGQYNHVPFEISGPSNHFIEYGGGTSYSVFSFTLNALPGILPPACQTSWTGVTDDVVIQLGEPGCALAGDKNPGGVLWTQVGGTGSQCLVPNGSKSQTFKDWENSAGQYSPGLAHFILTWNLPISPGLDHYNWAGRTITTSDSNISTTCGGPAITIFPYAIDYVNADNSTDDYMGWPGIDEIPNTFQVNRNRLHSANPPAASCALTYSRNYHIDCGGGTVELVSSLPLQEVIDISVPPPGGANANTIEMYNNGNAEGKEPFGQSRIQQIVNFSWICGGKACSQ